MKTSKLWYIPAGFFLVTCIINLAGCLSDSPVERYVKPALMPLLCVTTAAYLLCAAPDAARGKDTARMVALLLAGQLFGYAGDTMIMSKDFPFFAGGIGLFLMGHLCYISLFGSLSWKGLKTWQWIWAVALMLSATALLIVVIGVKGAMLAPMGIYGFVLTWLVFSALAGVLRPKAVVRGGRATWCMLLCGAVLFLFSDALIAVRTFGTLSSFMGGFGVMSTYLVAQSLLAIGGIRLIINK